MSEYEYDCADCGQRVSATTFHPYLYCELYKLGHSDQEEWLRSYGFERVSEPSRA